MVLSIDRLIVYQCCPTPPHHTTQEVTRPAGVPIDAARVRSLCRAHPVGAIVDNKMRARVWAAILLDAQVGFLID